MSNLVQDEKYQSEKRIWIDAFQLISNLEVRCNDNIQHLTTFYPLTGLHV